MPRAARLELEAVDGRVLAGLDKARALEVGRGYLSVTAGMSSSAGAFGRLELGARPLEQLEVFAYGQVATGLPAIGPSFGPVFEAGVGARVRW